MKKCNGKIWLEYIGWIYCTREHGHDGACVYGVTSQRASEIEDTIDRAWRENKRIRQALADAQKVLAKANA
tara:strand:- start:32014 stop:32226 length:213 start_codon:yes stop_codon:yes gene_type:complete